MYVVADLQASAANRKKAVRSNWSIGMNKALAQNVSHEKVRLFAEAFAKIQEATGVPTAELAICGLPAASMLQCCEVAFQPHWLVGPPASSCSCSAMFLCTALCLHLSCKSHDGILCACSTHDAVLQASRTLTSWLLRSMLPRMATTRCLTL
eukprot:GHRQ01023569.1.p1 GENE.GHRQ01023569.1~~GHRQ01023569.1.p1  ORF type:complete len:152 (+),score=21.72 GHRQ01023569.1:631-1086(+)